MGKAKKSIYKRVVLKLSGEAFQGKTAFGIDEKALLSIAQEIKEVKFLGLEVAVVVGGGNLFRGKIASSSGKIDRSTADYMGMLATVINGLALQDALERRGLVTRCLTAIEMRAVAEPHIRRRALHHLELDRVVIFGAGTGNPYFTTDTAAALRALEINAEILLKATKVDGIYEEDPKINLRALKYQRINYKDALNLDKVAIMDNTALSLCMDNDLPIIVFDLMEPNSIERVILGEGIGTLVGRQPTVFG